MSGAGGVRFFYSYVFDNLAGFQAGSAHGDPFRLAIDQGADRLKIGIKTSLSSIVSVGDIVTGSRFLSAYFTNFCHFSS